MSDTNLSAFIWSVADLLRGDYKQSEYGKVILPFTVLRRLDCVLEPTKAAVLEERSSREQMGLFPEPFLLRKSGQLFFNTSDAKPGELSTAIAPVCDRLMKRYRAAEQALRTAKERQDQQATESVRNELEALLQFKRDMGALVRLYTFLSQIFDYQNTVIEKRAIFYKLILPQLEFGRQREGIDLSKIVLTHHHLRNLGKRAMPLHEGETPKLAPLTETGSGSVQEKEKVLLTEIIRKLNDLFGEATTEHDQLVYVNQTIKGKLLESSTLRKQAASNSKEQFASSPDLRTELQNAIIASYDAHTAMSTRALNSPAVLEGLMEVLLNYSKLWESLRNQAAG